MFYSPSILALLLMFSVFMPARAVIAECTQAEANRKMQAHGLYQTRHLQTYKQDPDPIKDWKIRERNGNYIAEVTQVGAILAEGNYVKACKTYDEIAKKYEIDLASLVKEIPPSSMPANSLSKANVPLKSNKSKCLTASDAVNLNNELMQRAQDKATKGEVPQTTYNSYLQDMGQFAYMFSTNPTESCNRLKQLESKYSLQK